VELRNLDRPGWIRDRVKHLGVSHGRRPVLIDQVQLDFHAHPRRAGLEPALPEHPGEHVQRTLDLLPVLTPVLAADLDRLNFTTHKASLKETGKACPLWVPPHTF